MTRRSYTPTRRFFLLLGGLGLLSLGCFWFSWLALPWLAGFCLLVLATVAEGVYLSRAEMTLVAHTTDVQPTVRRDFQLRLTVQARPVPGVHWKAQSVETDVLSCPASPAHCDALLRADHWRVAWNVLPRRRGYHVFPGACIGYGTPLGLLTHWQTLPDVSLKIYPRLNHDLRQTLNPALLLEDAGMKTQRLRRADQVFESLRPYQVGDNYRHIDWKATARMSHLVTRQFEVEQHHNILVCLDNSRLMGTLADGVSKMDWAIEATLHLAYLAGHFQDRIGLMVFSNAVERWVKPLNKPVDAFLQNVFDLENQTVEADFSLACQTILAQQKKRSLVIFLTDLLDAGSLKPSLPAFASLRRKHFTLFIGIEDPAYGRYLQNPQAGTAEEVARHLVAQDAMSRRKAVLEQLRQMGLQALTVSPSNLVERAMQAYAEIKQQGGI